MIGKKARKEKVPFRANSREVLSMSMESAVAFYERVEKDAELRKKLRVLGSGETVRSYLKNELGYDFSEEELRKALSDRNPEMTDGDWEAVTGGAHYPIFDWK